MKIISFFLFLFLFFPSISAQTKVDEYGRQMSSDDESARIDAFLSALEDSNNRGLIVIYNGNNKERLGNLLGHIKGIKRYIPYREGYLERISIRLAEGDSLFGKELWTANKNEEFPKFNIANISLRNLKRNYLYARNCFDCDPTVFELSKDIIDYANLATVLNENKDYKLFIYLHKQYLKLGIKIREMLKKDLGLRDAGKVRLKLVKDSTPFGSFYIIPKIVKNSGKQKSSIKN
jgi:hypothetical protein